MLQTDELLLRLTTLDSMDFCEDLTNIQSILNYANEYIKPLNKIRFRGGNEPYIEDIVNKIQALFVKQKYVDAKTKEPLPKYAARLRKITFYLILNTEATFKYDLMKDCQVSHLLNTLPAIPKCLLHSCIWSLSLDRYFCECIAYAPTWFAFQFIENVVESLKYADPYETLMRVDQVVRAIYLNIARLDFRQMEIVEQKIILSKYFDVTMDLMRHFYSPDAEKFQNWTKNKYRKYMGHVVKHNLEMICYCFDLFRKRPVLKGDPIEMEMYALMREREPLIDDHRNVYTDVVQDTLHRMNTTLLNALQFNVMQVDCNTFMYWVEVDLDEEYTLQRTIGEVAYKVEQIMNVNECFEHDVGAQLRAISIKPKTIEQIIAQSTIGEMIEKLEKLANTNDRTVPLWLDAFIGHGELVLNNIECLETLEMHFQSLTVAQVKRIILYAANKVGEGDDATSVDEKLIEICLNTFDQLNNAEIFDLVQYSMDEQKQHFSYLQLDNFDQFLIEIFNKTTFVQNQKAYLKLLIQNPHLFYDKLFDEALTTDAQMQNMIEILTATASIFKNFIQNAIKDLIESKANTMEPNSAHIMPKLLAQLFFIDVVPPKEFIVDTLYKRFLLNAMKQQNYSRILLIMTTLTIISAKYKFDGICPPLLVMASQVMELCRWNVLTFTDESVAIVLKTIEFITAVLKVFMPVATDAEKEWLSSRIAMHSRSTQYYFQKLSLNKNESITRFDEFMWPENRQIDNSEHCVKFLCELIVRCSAKEMRWLASNNRLLPCFWEAFHLVSAVVERSKKDAENNCLRYACNAFLPIVENCLESSAEPVHKRQEIFEELLKFLSKLTAFTFFNDLLANAQTMIIKTIGMFDKETKSLIYEHMKLTFSQIPDSDAKTVILSKFETESE